MQEQLDRVSAQNSRNKPIFGLQPAQVQPEDVFEGGTARSNFQCTICYQIVQAFSLFFVCTGGLESGVASSDSGKHDTVSNQESVSSSTSLAGFQLTAILLQQHLQKIQLLRDKQHPQQRRKAQSILSFNSYSRMRAARLYGKSSCQRHKRSTPPSMTLKFW